MRDLASHPVLGDAPPGTQSPIPAQGNGRRLLSRLDDLLKEVAEVVYENVETGSHTNGARVMALEQAFKAYLGVPEAIALNSGSSALRAACELLRLPPGTEVIVPLPPSTQ